MRDLAAGVLSSSVVAARELCEWFEVLRDFIIGVSWLARDSYGRNKQPTGGITEASGAVPYEPSMPTLESRAVVQSLDTD
jgi:hypothetical protein